MAYNARATRFSCCYCSFLLKTKPHQVLGSWWILNPVLVNRNKLDKVVYML